MQDERFNNLEIKVSYQEELLNELNIIVAKQQRQIDFLIKNIEESSKNQIGSQEKSLFEQLKDERPPHY